MFHWHSSLSCVTWLSLIVREITRAEGYNIALLDCAAAEVLNCGLYETRSVLFKSEQCSNLYFVAKYYDELNKDRAAQP